MSVDFGNLPRPAAMPNPVNPIDLFRTLKIKDVQLKDLWLAQGDALRDWHANRDSNDTAIVLNTGAGKSLVGLLAAQSLVNETNGGKVLYACSSKQLVRQTSAKAEGYGLKVTTYYEGNFSNSLFQQGMAPCITTYHALFTGFTRFESPDLSAVVFDDAHTAGHILREQFTLRISKRIFLGLYAEITQLFRGYFDGIGKGVGYRDIIEGQDYISSRFVPPFTIVRNSESLTNSLISADLSSHVQTKFSWQRVKDAIDLCAVFVSSDSITLTPCVVPSHAMRYFAEDVKRIYLSATMPTGDAFMRSFGITPSSILAPETNSGECERLVLFPRKSSAFSAGGEEIGLAQTIAPDQKRLVLVPTRKRARSWEAIATFNENETATQVEEFTDAQAPATLVLTARYDGIDLPGESCRVMFIDDLPTGLNPLERFIWEQLRAGTMLNTTIASRIVQSFGRISRGTNDYGVVVVSGSRLVEWLDSPRNQALLPPFLQKQIKIGALISETVDEDQLNGFAQACLNRNEGWSSYYQQAMESQSIQIPSPTDTGQLFKISQVEAEFGKWFWERDFARAAKSLEDELDSTSKVSRPMAAWHALWLGYCYDRIGDSDRAITLYSQANGMNKEIPAFGGSFTASETEHIEQAVSIANLLTRNKSVALHLPSTFDTEVAGLLGNADSKSVERALESLGTYLGLESSRPDNEFRTGPDVLWRLENGKALSIEAKTDKEPSSKYYKKDIGQIRDHHQWIADHYQSTEIVSAFVGPKCGPAHDSNPDEGLIVIELKEFAQLSQILRATLIDISAQASIANAVDVVDHLLTQRGLKWPELLGTLSSVRLVDIS